MSAADSHNDNAFNNLIKGTKEQISLEMRLIF